MTMYARIITANCDGETEKQHERKIRTVAKKVDFPVYFPVILEKYPHKKRINGNEKITGHIKEISYSPFMSFQKKEDPGKKWRKPFYCQCEYLPEYGCCFMFPFENWDEYKKRLSEFSKARTICGSSILYGDGCGPVEASLYDDEGNIIEVPENLWSEEDD